jgi:glycerophosphoryl diester phosphodiesterase
MNSHFFTPPLPRLIAHRGFSGRYPENTLTAFQAAVDAGSHYIELDVWLSRDRHLVVHHDKNCSRTCGVDSMITAMTLTEITALDAGFGFSPDQGLTFPFRNLGVAIPSLEEVLKAYPGIFFTIEIKDSSPGIETTLLETLRRCGKEDKVLIASAADELMARIRRHHGEIPTGCTYDEAEAFMRTLQKGELPGKPPGDVLHLPMYYKGINLISPPVIEAAQALGVEIHVWTVNQRKEIASLLAQGVAGITSDFPDLLREVAENL